MSSLVFVIIKHQRKHAEKKYSAYKFFPATSSISCPPLLYRGTNGKIGVNMRDSFVI